MLNKFIKEISDKVGAKEIFFEGHIKGGTEFKIKEKKLIIKVEKIK